MVSAHPDKVASAYSRHVHYYDRRWHRYLDATHRVTIEMLALTGSERILDVACGTGELERHILERFPAQPIWGVDLTDEMLDVAREKLKAFPHVQLEHADCHYLPYPDAHFDIVVTCSAFHYLQDPRRVVSEFARVVRPGGRVMVLDWCRNHLLGKLYNAFRRLFIPSHFHVYTTAEMESLMRGAQLSIAKTRRFTAVGMWKMMSVVGVRP